MTVTIMGLLSLLALCGPSASWPIDGPGSAAAPAARYLLPAPMEGASVARRTATPMPVTSATDVATATPLPRPKTGKVESFTVIPGETTLTYTVTQVLLDQGGLTEVVVGKTDQVAGQFTLNYDEPSTRSFGQITANLNTLASGNQERDEALRSQWLEFARFPLADFSMTEVRGFPADFRPTEPVSFELVGDLTLKGVSQPAIWDTTAALNLDRLKGTATTFLHLSDYGVPMPGVLGLIQVMDGVTVTLQFGFKMIEPPPLPSSC